MDHFTPCTIGLGSNTVDREYQIAQATEYICGILHKCSVSSVYESEAFNGKDKPYLNAVIHGLSPISEEALIKHLKDWEALHGRTQVKTLEGVIPIDLDLIIWDSRILRPKDFERHYFNVGYRELLASGAFQDE
ncbi:MAG: 2-amino-4-hydroxy-6-hydroxymethyldihydropteridine diphosphokinase [Muribaculaceae bacterium]|nr:2-amino-4-hydroxy-6-hydroxymethyldihydropteridine diphosphokinase [Muribaculaceae bacterium]